MVSVGASAFHPHRARGMEEAIVIVAYMAATCFCDVAVDRRDWVHNCQTEDSLLMAVIWACNHLCMAVSVVHDMTAHVRSHSDHPEEV